MKELKFEVGKKYKFSDGRTENGRVMITGRRFIFRCHSVDVDGDCWTMDSKFDGISGDRYCNLFNCHGWCVAKINLLRSGEVVEVPE